MRVGTKSVLFGAHCFFIHPFFVAVGWWIACGFDNSTWPTLILGLAHRKSLTLRRTVEAIDPPPFPLDGKVFENGPEPSRARK